MAIPSATKRYHHVGTTQHDIQMGIRSEDAAHILTVLSDLYSDKIMAVIREYSTNARDSHLEAGVDLPIRVTLPTQNSLEFSVEDFGVGLSVNDIEKIYANYGASSKRENAEVTGQLGLGSKSGLTYAPQFTVTAVKNGVQVVAVVTKDEVGIGVIRILDTRHTEKPNGVKITFPVNASDVQAFYIKATQFFRYWEAGTFEVVQGNAPVDILSIFNDPKWTHLDDDVLVLPEWGDIKILMGGVTYTAPERIPGISVLARVNMGDIDFTPSRESLHMTSQSRYCLDVLEHYVLSRMADKVAEKILASSRWDGAAEYLRWDESMRKQIKNRHPNAVRRWSAHVGSGVAWRYVTWRSTARKTGQTVRYDSLKNSIVVVDHPFKALSPNIREALNELYNELVRGNAASINDAIVLPRGAVGTEDLEGHPYLYTYDEIKARVKKKPRAPRKKVQYEVTLVSGVKTHVDEDAVPVQNPLYTVAEAFHPSENLIKHFGLPVVHLRSSNQENKFKRLYPKARLFLQVKAEAVEAVRKALTDNEWEAMRMAYYRNLSIDPKDIDSLLVPDDALKRALLLSAEPSANMRVAQLLGVKGNVSYGWRPKTLKELEVVGIHVNLGHGTGVNYYNALYRAQGQAIVTALGLYTGSIEPAPLFAW